MGEPGAWCRNFELEDKVMTEMLRYRGWVATMIGFLPEAGTMLTSKVRAKRKYSRIQFATGRGGGTRKYFPKEMAAGRDSEDLGNQQKQN